MNDSEPEKAVTIKTPEEIRLMYQANQIVAGVLGLLKSRITPGVSTFQLDKWAEEYCCDHQAKPAFKGYRGFPASLCASINEEVVHGIPSKKRILRDGDIVSLDFGTLYQGFYGDAAITVPVRIDASSGSFSGTLSRQPDAVQVCTGNFSSGLASTLS